MRKNSVLDGWFQKRKFFVPLLFLICLLFAVGCARGADQEPEKAEPVLVFAERAIEIETGERTVRGLLSRSMQQIAALTVIAPETLLGMKYYFSPMEITASYSGCTADILLPEDSVLSSLIEALNRAADITALTRSETGWMGVLSSGETFSILTAENGDITEVRLPGASVRFYESNPSA